ncbi:MAG: 4Fe-4S binding protein, partial [Deltaproteobacteria bacterium]|nr:4Fe-4S binding protein [Deltaproteobacteria bacterium]
MKGASILSVKGWRAVVIVRRTISWGLLALLAVALANPESYEGVLASLPKRQFGQLAASWFSYGARLAIPLLILALSTLLLGRWFCGFICPLGASMDAARLIRQKVKKGRLSYKGDSLFRSLVPFAVWALFWLGVSVPMGDLEPFSIVASGPEIWIAILIIAAWRGRAFCNWVCPAGWLLKLIGSRSLLGIKIDSSKCRRCGACQRACQARCVEHKSGYIDPGRCLACFECASVCPDGAVGFGYKNFFASTSPGPDTRRRDFLRLAGAAALAGGSFLSSEERRIAILGPAPITPILPPGALSLAHLAAHCTSCHTCVRVCPNQALESS